jgi:hemoglobin
MPSILFDEIGGEPAVAAVVDALYERVLADPSLMPYFDGRDLDRLKAHQRALVTVALGGTAQQYTGRMMHPAHAGLAITDEAFDKVLDHLSAAFAGAGVAPAAAANALGMLRPLRTDVVQEPAELRV